MEHHGKRTLALLTSLLLALTLGLTACGTNANESSSPTEADAATTQTTAEASSELVGKPWATGILQNNLPAEQPAAKDDLYTHYAYQFLSDHQAEPVTNVLAYAAEIPGTATDIINDTSASTNELDQLRIFYQQAADVE